MVIPKDTPLSDCTEAVIHITKTYSYYDNNTDFMGNNRMEYNMFDIYFLKYFVCSMHVFCVCVNQVMFVEAE